MQRHEAAAEGEGHGLHPVAEVELGRGSPLQQLCFGLDPLLLLGLPLLVFGLCRAGVLGWWALGSVIAGTVLLPFSPTSTNLVVAGAFLLIQVPLAVGGVRLVARIWLRG